MRYQVVKDAEHSCCFEAEIIDTEKPYIQTGTGKALWYESIGEFRDTETAELVCGLLNNEQ